MVLTFGTERKRPCSSGRVDFDHHAVDRAIAGVDGRWTISRKIHQRKQSHRQQSDAEGSSQGEDGDGQQQPNADVARAIPRSWRLHLQLDGHAVRQLVIAFDDDLVADAGAGNDFDLLAVVLAHGDPYLFGVAGLEPDRCKASCLRTETALRGTTTTLSRCSSKTAVLTMDPGSNPDAASTSTSGAGQARLARRPSCTILTMRPVAMTLVVVDRPSR